MLADLPSRGVFVVWRRRSHPPATLLHLSRCAYAFTRETRVVSMDDLSILRRCRFHPRWMSSPGKFPLCGQSCKFTLEYAHVGSKFIAFDQSGLRLRFPTELTQDCRSHIKFASPPDCVWIGRGCLTTPDLSLVWLDGNVRI